MRDGHLLTVTWGEGSTEASMTLGVLRGRGGGGLKKHNGEVCLVGMRSVGSVGLCSCASAIKTKLNFRLVR